MKHEWRKHEKEYYLPKAVPKKISVPKFSFFTIAGKGNPNDKAFGAFVEALYTISYAVRMCTKNGFSPIDYCEYTVYPLEGVWDISDEAKKHATHGIIDKDTLVFELMIRQPEFLTKELAFEILERTKIKKPHSLLSQIVFKEIEEGNCIQMKHLGSFDTEPESFAKMEQFAIENGYKRKLLTHREIYLTDARKTAPENQKTVLRFEIE
ncbi:MAG TPA: hypothetical protein DCQ31_15160 [Bacteroidales bacterium]|nr:hypothetical protein [Bacteroidales bacterium]